MIDLSKVVTNIQKEEEKKTKFKGYIDILIISLCIIGLFLLSIFTVVAIVWSYTNLGFIGCIFVSLLFTITYVFLLLFVKDTYL